MGFQFHMILPIFVFLCIAITRSDASLPAQAHWKSIFPNTPMPKSLKELLKPAAGNTKNLVEAYAKSKGTLSDANYRYQYLYGNKNTTTTTNNLVDTYENSKGTSSDIRYRYRYLYGNGNKTTKKSKEETPKHEVRRKDQEVADIIAELGNIFFLEDDLHQGKTMRLLDLTTKANKATFLPRPVANSIPFSSDKFPQILQRFSLKPNTADANILKEPIEDCKRPAMPGEDKYCSTSLESMVDFAVSKLGNRIQTRCSEMERETESQEFAISNVQNMGGDYKEIVCHQMPYAYAVFYCHSIEKTTVHGVPLVSKDGTKGEGIAVCHRDTSFWSPNHLAFQLLKVEPGTAPICHFLARETIVWIPN